MIQKRSSGLVSSVLGTIQRNNVKIETKRVETHAMWCIDVPHIIAMWENVLPVFFDNGICIFDFINGNNVSWFKSRTKNMYRAFLRNMS